MDARGSAGYARLIGETIEMKTVLAEGSALVKADASQLEQVVVNLATNARDARPAGGKLTIATALVEAEGDRPAPE